VELQQQTYALKVNFNNAHNYLLPFARRSSKGLEEIQTTDPGYPGLNAALDQAHSLLSLDSQYSEAMQKKEDGDLAGALAILQDIEAKHPGYRDESPYKQGNSKDVQPGRSDQFS